MKNVKVSIKPKSVSCEDVYNVKSGMQKSLLLIVYCNGDLVLMYIYMYTVYVCVTYVS